MDFVQSKIAQHPIFVFSKSYCPYCKKAKSVLDSTGVKYEVEEVDYRRDCLDIIEALGSLTGARTVPRIFVGGTCIGGCSDIVELHRNDKLTPLLQAQFKY